MKLGTIAATFAVLATAIACNQLFGHDAGVYLAPDASAEASTDASTLPETLGPADTGMVPDSPEAATTVDGGAEASTIDSGAEASTADASPDGPVLLVAPDAGLSEITSLAVYQGVLYGTNNGADPAHTTGPMWSVSTSGGQFRFISPYDARTNGAGDVHEMGISPPYAYFGVSNEGGGDYGVWRAALDGSETVKLFGFYNGEVLALDAPGWPYLYLSDARNPGFVAEPKAGDPSPPSLALICDSADLSAYPPPLQILTDGQGDVFWAYNGRSPYPPVDAAAPLVQSVSMATAADVATWTHSSCPARVTLASGVDVQGLGVDTSHVYWSDSTPAIWSVPVAGPATPANLSASVSFPASPDTPARLVSDGKHVFWAHGTPFVWAIAADGSTHGPPVAVVGASAGRIRIGPLTFDDSFLYFADNGDSTIWKVSRP